MFGMLDYRAHKLYWLIELPFRIVQRFTFFAIIFVAIYIAQQTSFNLGIKIVLAFVAMQVMAAINQMIIWRRIYTFLTHIFFWVIDVVPAHGADATEARAIVLLGRSVELNKKLATQIEEWTDKDTEELVSTSFPLRSRYIFPGKERIKQLAKPLIAEMKRIHTETGQQPNLQPTDINKIFDQSPDKFTWLEKFKVQAVLYLYSILGLAMIVLFFLGLQG